MGKVHNSAATWAEEDDLTVDLGLMNYYLFCVLTDAGNNVALEHVSRHL